MILPIEHVLAPAFCAEAAEALRSVPFEDGARTAGWAAKGSKHNDQAVGQDARVVELKSRIRDALGACDIFRAAAMPLRFGPLILNRYREGQGYGAHMDNAVMASAGSTIRSDLAFTIFLSDPAHYDGGELVIDTHGAEDFYKLPAGAMLLYPARFLHRVAPIREGERFAAVGWLQSLIRDAGKREILYDLNRAKQAVHDSDGPGETFNAIARAAANLMHLWVEV